MRKRKELQKVRFASANKKEREKDQEYSLLLPNRMRGQNNDFGPRERTQTQMSL